MSDKLVTVTPRQIKALDNGDFFEFAKNMINLGISLGRDGHDFESAQGPFKNDSDGSCLIIIKLKDEA